MFFRVRLPEVDMGDAGGRRASPQHEIGRRLSHDMTDSVREELLENAKFITRQEMPCGWRQTWPREPEVYTEYTYRSWDERARSPAVPFPEKVHDTIRTGILMPAKHGCVCFVKEHEGVALYVVVKYDKDAEKYVGVSIWAYVYDQTEAIKRGWPYNSIQYIQNLEPRHG